jgi:O-acetyl-ADP-ribose deacetylase (regulator of RNase III)
MPKLATLMADALAELLASCYRRSLEIARDHNLRTVAFPSISTGIYGYPIAQAARVALRTVDAFLRPSCARSKQINKTTGGGACQLSLTNIDSTCVTLSA